jgi:hypothetical protein
MNEEILYDRFFEIRRQKHVGFTTDAGSAVQIPGAPLWIRLRNGQEARPFFCAFLQDNPKTLHQLVAEREVALTCAECYAGKKGAEYQIRDMVAYVLPKEAVLSDPLGILKKPELEDVKILFKWFQSFFLETLEAPPPEKEGTPNEGDEPENKSLDFYIWKPAPNAPPVSMGLLTHGETIRRLNLIFTAKEKRRRGYGKAIVTALCKIVRDEGKMPMLYAYADNTAANGLYRGMGFVEAGRLAEVTFT